LRSCYSSWISTVDPGLPIAGQDEQGRTRASVPLAERYVQPDILLQTSETDETLQNRESTSSEKEEADRAAQTGERELRSATSGTRRARLIVRERRMPLDEYLSSRSHSLIVGEAGSGKSALLRFLALDILHDAPLLKTTRERFSGALPIWLPFALWARMAAGKLAAPPSIEDVIVEFFRVQGETALAEDMRRIASTKGVVLLVDGLDEATDTAAADTLIALLTAFVGRTGIAVVATSRPHGIRNLSGFGGSWDVVELAPLSDEQRHSLANLWFRVLETLEAGSSSEESQIRAHAKRKPL